MKADAIHDRLPAHPHHSGFPSFRPHPKHPAAKPGLFDYRDGELRFHREGAKSAKKEIRWRIESLPNFVFLRALCDFAVKRIALSPREDRALR